MKSVAIIGAGISGLSSLHHALEIESFEPVLFEMSNSVGGVWVYDHKHAKLGHWPDIYSTIYANLVTNQPKQIMELPDYKFEEGVPTYLNHDMVLAYLKGYCAEFDLMNHIRLRHKVLNVVPVHPKKATKSKEVLWKVDVCNLETNEVESIIFDAVVVANGHHAKPQIPEFPGVEKYKGRITHSRSYRKPSHYKNQIVMVVGAGPSGLDISLDVASFADQVYISHRDEPLVTELPTNVTQVACLKHFNEGYSVTLADDAELQVTAIIYCTGYVHSVPFLDPKCGITMEPKRVTPLYKYIVNITYPNLVFIGLPDFNVPVFRMLNLQSIYAIGVLAGKIQLPSKKEMLQDEAKEHSHQSQVGIRNCGWDYTDFLCEKTGMGHHLPTNMKNLYDFIIDHRTKNLIGYKKEDFVLNEENEYIVVRK